MSNKNEHKDESRIKPFKAYSSQHPYYLSHAIEAYRAIHQITQAELCTILEVDEALLYKLGKCIIPKSHLDITRIAGMVGIEPRFLANTLNKLEIEPTKIENIISLASTLRGHFKNLRPTPEFIREVRNFIEVELTLIDFQDVLYLAFDASDKLWQRIKSGEISDYVIDGPYAELAIVVA